MNEINPPAQVCKADSLDSIGIKARSMFDSICHQESTTQELRAELGIILIQAKQLCKHGEWLPFLAKHKISSQRASEFMSLANSRNPGVSDANSTQNEENFSSGDTATTSVDNSETGQTGPILCKRCLRLFPGVGRPDCLDCKAMREGAAAKRRKKTKRTTEREPGDDTEAEQAEKDRATQNGQAVWNRKVFNEELGKALRELSKLARQHGAVDARGVPHAPEYHSIRSKLTEAEKEASAWAAKLKRATA